MIDTTAATDPDKIAIYWHIDDVKEVAPDPTDDQAREVLRRAKHHHTATIGISWDVLDTIADDVREEATKQAS